MDWEWFSNKNNSMKSIQFNALTGETSEIEVLEQTEIKSNIQMNILTKYQFMNRLTIPERIAIFSLENSNPMVKMWLEMFKIADEIDVTNAETIAGVNMLASMGIIEEIRIEEILKPILNNI